MAEATYVKSAGYDWIVFYTEGDDPTIETVTVFGQVTIEKAIEEARFSLDPDNDDPDYMIVGARRTDMKEL